MLARVRAFARFSAYKAIHGRGLQTDGLIFVGRDCKIYLADESSRIVLHSPVHLSDQVMLESAGLLEIGPGSSINSHSRVVAFQRVTLGRNVTLAQHVTVLDHDHGYRYDDDDLILDGYDTAPITIGDNVWLGDKCTVLKGVTIGNNVIAGANTLINKDVPPDSLIVGVPFRVIRRLR